MAKLPETAPPEIGLFGDAQAHLFSMSKQEYLDEIGTPGLLPQFGGAYVDREFSIPELDDPPATEQIETFLVDVSGASTPMGSNERLISTYGDLVSEVASAIVETAMNHGVPIDGPGFVTASVRPFVDLLGTPHFDDEHFAPDDGVGLVGILATHDGTRFARNALRLGEVRANMPLPVEPDELDGFWSADVPKQIARPGRLVVASQFGQLHAGPKMGAAATSGHRTMVVARFPTRPGH